jgi:hypothetical protein
MSRITLGTAEHWIHVSPIEPAAPKDGVPGLINLGVYSPVHSTTVTLSELQAEQLVHALEEALIACRESRPAYDDAG